MNSDLAIQCRRDSHAVIPGTITGKLKNIIAGGCDDCVSQPIDKKELFSKIEKRFFVPAE